MTRYDLKEMLQEVKLEERVSRREHDLLTQADIRDLVVRTRRRKKAVRLRVRL